MKIDRKWSMANKRTFQIRPIKQLIERETRGLHVIDPFPYPFKEFALDYLQRFNDNSVDCVLFDPPYSLRQLKECYDGIGHAITGEDSRLIYTKWKDEIARVIRSGGICISFAWNTNGLGKKRGFDIERILIVAHGGAKNDTLVTVERKIQENLVNCLSTRQLPRYKKKITNLLMRYDFKGIIMILGITILSAIILVGIILFVIWFIKEFIGYLEYRESWV